MQVLLDGDIIAYRCASSANEVDQEDVAHSRINDLINRILHAVGSLKLAVYLSGGRNYRKDICPEYKANRIQDPPMWLQSCREFLVKEYKASVTDGIEADDAIGIDSNKLFVENLPFTIVSLDKDLKQLPGRHYSWEFSGISKGKPWIKQEQHSFVSPLEGIRFFYKQLLTGDRADNVTGIAGIGPVKADKLIEPLWKEEDMFEVVRSQYNDDVRLIKNGRLLWIKKTEDDLSSHCITKLAEVAKQ